MKNLFSLVLPVTLALSNAAFAQDVPATVKMDGAVALEASTIAEGILSEAQVQVIKDISHQKAVAISCDGFAVDEARLSEALLAAYPEEAAYAALDEVGQLKTTSTIMLVMGVFIGGNVAIASTDPAAWCANAQEEKSRTDAPNRIWAD